jgi:hypothetical protein
MFSDLTPTLPIEQRCILIGEGVLNFMGSKICVFPEENEVIFTGILLYLAKNAQLAVIQSINA